MATSQPCQGQNTGRQLPPRRYGLENAPGARLMGQTEDVWRKMPGYTARLSRRCRVSARLGLKLLVRKWDPVFRTVARCSWSLRAVCHVTDVAADNANDASRRVRPRPEETPTVGCRGFRRRNA